VLLAGVLACAGAVAAAAPSQAATGRSSAPLSVTLFLAPADRAALHRLAADTTLARPARAKQLAAVRPSGATRSAVVRELRSLGLSVRSTTTWSVTATGSRSRITSIFGSARATASASPFAHALPRRPAALARDVTAVVGGDETRPAKVPLGLHAVTPAVTGPPYDGPALRSLYHQSTDGAPGGGTIATLQFDGWSGNGPGGDMQAYAQFKGIGPSSYSYTEVPVVTNGVPRDPRQVDSQGGTTEVALDQETLLGVAPHAAQRAYFAENSDQGSLDMLHQVAADATDATHGYYNLVALSTSWGMCEPAAQAAGTMQAEEDAYEEIVAAGVTVFAATGDGGAYDCPGSWGYTPPVLAVDFPASSPVVIGVGGTTRWTSGKDTGWDGSGGGVSQVFARPAYQSGLLASRGNHRLVPDISADADPMTGFTVYSQGALSTVGGTSLAAPAMTGMFVNTLTDISTRGRGNILPLLYRSPATALTDVTSGGSSVYPATTGYDLSTGLGAPVWDVLGPIVAPRPRWTSRSYTGAWGTGAQRPPPVWGTG
jgi:kumamolisin